MTMQICRTRMHKPPILPPHRKLEQESEKGAGILLATCMQGGNGQMDSRDVFTVFHIFSIGSKSDCLKNYILT